MRTSAKAGYRQGPRSRISLRLTPVDDLAESSKTGLNFVVVELSLKTPCTGR